MSNFVKTLIDDLLNKDWPEGTTDLVKNEYRMKVVFLMVGLAIGGALFIHPLVSIIPLAVAARKLMIIQKTRD